MDMIFEGIIPAGGMGGPSKVKKEADDDAEDDIKMVHPRASANKPVGGSIIPVIPTCGLHSMMQFCSLLSGQLQEGAPPGSDNPSTLPVLKVDQEEDNETLAMAADAGQQATETNTPLSQTEDDKDRVGTSTYAANTTVTNMETDKVNFDNPDVVEAVFQHCLVWAFAGPLQLKDQLIVDDAIKALSGMATIDEGSDMPFTSPGMSIILL